MEIGNWLDLSGNSHIECVFPCGRGLGHEYVDKRARRLGCRYLDRNRYLAVGFLICSWKEERSSDMLCVEGVWGRRVRQRVDRRSGKRGVSFDMYP